MVFRPYVRQVNAKIGNSIRDDPANIGESFTSLNLLEI